MPDLSRAVVGAALLGPLSLALLSPARVSARAGVLRPPLAARPAQHLPPDRAVERWIHEASSTIERNDYGKVASNPFLVSALYYSDRAVTAMAGSKGRPARIISAIRTRISNGFRKEYLDWLGKTEAKRLSAVDGDAFHLPLAKITYVWKIAFAHRDAIDLVAPEGTPVVSMSRGVVILAENGWQATNDLSTSSEMGGNTVIVYSPEQHTFFRYAHLKESAVKAGDVIASGTVIGAVGHTGTRATRPGHGRHLHLEMNRWEAETDTIATVRATELKEILDSRRGGVTR